MHCMKELRIYKTRNGKEPFKEWLSKIKDIRTMAQIDNRIRRLALNNKGDYKRVGKGVYEMRIHYGAGYRVYFSEQGNKIVILLSGGDKGTQKRDIKQAITYWQDYKERYNEKN